MTAVQRYELPGTSSLRRWRCTEPLRGASTAHPGIELTWLRAGSADYRSSSRQFTARPGQLVLVPAGVEHETSLSPGLEGTVLELDVRTMDEIASATSSAGRRFDGLTVVDGGEGVAAIGEVLADEVARGGADSQLVVEALVEALVVRLLRATPVEVRSPGAKDPRILAAIDFVRANVCEPVAVVDMAKAAGMSRYHFSRLFRESTGASPHTFVLESRARHAASLLRRGSRSVTEVAFSSGFSDLGRFRAAFRRTFGVMPSEYVSAFRSAPSRPSPR